MEGFVYYVFCFLCILGVIIVASSIALIGGSATLISGTAKPEQRKSLWIPAALVIIGGSLLLIIGYGFWWVNQSVNEFSTEYATNVASYTPEYFNADNEEMRPFITAVNKVDRASLGFSSIPANARVEMNRTSGPPATYDVMLHIYAGNTSRTIAFKKEGVSYKWVGEQEINRGPNQYETVDGVFYEQIVIAYETVSLGGAPRQNSIYVDYLGEDPRLDKLDLTLKEVQPILEEWRTVQQATPTLPNAAN